jgi:hypothetical protein
MESVPVSVVDSQYMAIHVQISGERMRPDFSFDTAKCSPDFDSRPPMGLADYRMSLGLDPFDGAVGGDMHPMTKVWLVGTPGVMAIAYVKAPVVSGWGDEMPD